MKRILFLTFPFFLLLAGCAALSGSDATPTPLPASELQVFIASNDFAVGKPRVPFVLYDGPEHAANLQSVQVGFYDLTQEPPQQLWTGAAENFTDYEVPYWVVYPEIPSAGNWGLGLTITRDDGQTVKASAVIAAAETTEAPAIGQRPPASQNRTLDTVPDVARLTSGQDPVPGLYQMTVAEAMASGRPTVVTFATPAFCASQLCTPVVDSVEEVYRGEADAANFIHLEIYKEFDPLVPADEVAEWQLPSEPWTFVLDDDGRVVARFGGPVSPREIEQALAPLINDQQ